VVALGGHVTEYDRQYQLLEGRAYFDDVSNDPTIFVKVARDYGAVTVYLTLTGTARHPRETLSSSPASYSQDQLLAVVLGDNPDTEDVGVATDAQKAVNLGAPVLLKGLREISSDVPSFAFSVDSVQGASGAPASRYNVGKWFGDDTHVVGRYAPDVVGTLTWEVVVEWRLLRELVLEGIAGGRAWGGADLLWVHRF